MCAQVSRVLLFVLAVVVALACPASALAADPPAPVPLTQGWQYSPDPSGPGPDRELAERAHRARRGSRRPSRTSSTPRPLAQLFKGTVGWYRVGFTGPATAPRAPAGGCASSRCAARRASGSTASRSARHRDPYTPFELPGQGPAGRPAEPARRARRQPPPARHARGLVELGRDHAPGVARRRAARSCCTTPACCRAARCDGAGELPLGARSSTAGWRTAARARSSPRCA